MRLGLLLAMTGSAAGKYYAGAATLAIAAINADPSFMKGRRLEYIYADAGCNAIQGVNAALELLRSQSEWAIPKAGPSQSKWEQPLGAWCDWRRMLKRMRVNRLSNG